MSSEPVLSAAVQTGILEDYIENLQIIAAEAKAAFDIYRGQPNLGAKHQEVLERFFPEFSTVLNNAEKSLGPNKDKFHQALLDKSRETQNFELLSLYKMTQNQQFTVVRDEPEPSEENTTLVKRPIDSLLTQISTTLQILREAQATPIALPAKIEVDLTGNTTSNQAAVAAYEKRYNDFRPIAITDEELIDLANLYGVDKNQAKNVLNAIDSKQIPSDEDLTVFNRAFKGRIEEAVKHGGAGSDTLQGTYTSMFAERSVKGYNKPHATYQEMLAQASSASKVRS